MMSYLTRLWCKLFGHPGVYRQWEWSGLRPHWQERSDAWTCARCGMDVSAVDTAHRRVRWYRMARPVMSPDVVEQVNQAIEQFGVEFVRIRAGVASRHELSPIAPESLPES